MQVQVVPPKESPRVKAFDEKMVPLKQRRDVLNAQVSELLTVNNSYTVQNTPSERAVVESRLSLPQAQADLARIGLDIKDLERQRDDTLKAERAEVEEELNRQIGEEISLLRHDFETHIRPRNCKIHELEELKERLIGRTVSERFAWWDLLDETPTSETRWGIWTRSIAEYFRV